MRLRRGVTMEQAVKGLERQISTPPDGYSPVRKGVTVEILPDVPGHVRFQGNDQEIVDRCEFLKQVTGHQGHADYRRLGMRAAKP